MAENENMRDALLDDIDAELAELNMAPPPLPAAPPPVPAVPPPVPAVPPPPPPPASPATADEPYVARHRKGGWRVRAQEQNWAALEMMRAQALTLCTIISPQYRGRGRERGRERRGG